MKKMMLILVPLFILGTLLAAPLNEGFESATCPPSGWTIRYANPSPPSGNLMTHSPTYAYEGNRSFRFSSYSSGSPYDQYLITPQLSVTAGDQTVSFWYRKDTYGTEVFRVGWSSTGTEITDFTWSADITNASTIWQQYVKTDLPVGTKYVAVHYKSDYSYYLYIDAFVGPQIDVSAPPNPAVLVYPTNGGWAFLDDTLSWTSGGGIVDGYKLYISADATVNNDDFITYQPGTTYKLSDLEDLVIEYGHTYYWQVIPHNEIGDAYGCPVWSFKTPTATQLAEKFTDTTFPPIGWTSPPTSWVRDISTFFSSPASAKCGYTRGTWWLVTPKVSPNAENHTLSFWYKDYSSTSSYDYIDEYTYVLVSPTTDFTGADVIWTGDYQEFTIEWQQANLDLFDYIGTDIYIAFKHIATGGNYRYIDNVIGPAITPEAPGAPTLVSPADGAVNMSITPTFTWTVATTGGVPDGFKIYCGNPIDYDNPIATVPRTTTSYTIPGTNPLAYNTTYYWTVSAYKEGFEEVFAAVRSFTTREDPTIYTFPYTAGDFETGAIPLNWVVSEGISGSFYHWQAKTGSTGHGITQAHSGTYYGWLNCYYASQSYNPYCLITAPIDLGSTDNPKRLNYWYWIGASSFPATAVSPLCVDISTDNQVTWTTIYSHSKTDNLSDWYQNIVDLTDYNDNIVYLRFRAYSSYGSGETDMGLDDIIVEEIPLEPVLYCTPNSLDFGEVLLGVQAGPKYVTVTNIGGGTLTLIEDNVSITGPNSGMFTFDPSNLPANLSAGQQVNIPVWVTVTQEGPVTATLTITYEGTPYEVSLSAEGLPENIVVIGTGTEKLDLPIDPYYRYSYSQSIFLQSDIHITNRYIEKIYFYWNADGNAVNSNVWTVYLGHTDINDFADVNSWLPISEFSVYEVTLDLSAVEGWVEINLDPPFYHTDQNIVIAVDENIYGYDLGIKYFYCTSLESKGNRSISYANDSDNPDPVSPPDGTLVTGYPNIKLEFEEVPPPLPVELTSFTALFVLPESPNDKPYVQLNWVSQSETNLSGYRVYRNEENSLDNAILITPTMIPATNTSQGNSYSIEDSEVENNVTYYYWLESVDFNNSQFHGPVMVTIEGNVLPVLPEITTLNNAYPNPFRANNSTTIEVGIKAGETGTLTIYNIRGEFVKTLKLTQGYHTINWDGKDSKGKTCGSGIYFYRLNTPSLNQTKKMVIIK